MIYFVTAKESISNDQEFFVNVEMTVTSPNCPAIESLPEDIVYCIHTSLVVARAV